MPVVRAQAPPGPEPRLVLYLEVGHRSVTQVGSPGQGRPLSPSPLPANQRGKGDSECHAETELVILLPLPYPGVVGLKACAITPFLGTKPKALCTLGQLSTC